MKHALIFIAIGGMLVWRAMVLGGWWMLLIWPGGSFLVVGLGYASLGPCIFGKRGDGRMAWWAILALLPYLLLTWIVWHVRRLLVRGPAAQEVAPGLWLGRRPLLADLPQGVALLVDLTAEFPLNHAIRRRGIAYRCLPTLDASAGDDESFRELVRAIAASDSPVYVHCAVGFGRSASLMAAVLIARGLAADIAAAEGYLKRIRPGVRLGAEQRAQVARVSANVAKSDQP